MVDVLLTHGGQLWSFNSKGQLAAGSETRNDLFTMMEPMTDIYIPLEIMIFQRG